MKTEILDERSEDDDQLSLSRPFCHFCSGPDLGANLSGISNDSTFVTIRGLRLYFDVGAKEQGLYIVFLFRHLSS